MCDACGCGACRYAGKHTHAGTQPRWIALCSEPGSATPPGRNGPGWKPDELDPSFPLSFGVFICILVRKGSLAYLLVQDVHTLVFSLRRPAVRKPSYSSQPLASHKLASYSGWGPVPPPRPSPSVCVVNAGAVLPAVAICLLFQKEHGSSLSCQWSGLGTFCGPGSIRGPGTEIPKLCSSQEQAAAATLRCAHRSSQ